MSQKDLGMYACSDPDYPQVHVGEFLICRQDEESIWVQTSDGEGAAFPDQLFEGFLRAFFEEHF